MKKKFPVYRQLDYMDCGPSCLRMIAGYYGKDYSLEFLRQQAHITRDGVSLMGISEAADAVGFRSIAVKADLQQLLEDAVLPCILHWNQNHFVVLPPQRTTRIQRKKKILIADPAAGLIRIDLKNFLQNWTGNTATGHCLLLEPSPAFYEQEEDRKPAKGFGFLLPYLRPYRKYLMQLVVNILLSGLLSLVFPFLTQSLVDYGINRSDLNYIYLVLFSQLLLFLGDTMIELVRNRLLLHVNSRVNINLISDFLLKLMRLPIRFFDSKLTGDLIRRIEDHHRIQDFLTGKTLSVLFSLINLVLFSVVLGIYSFKLLTVFLTLSLASVAWIFFFLKRRKELDYVRFQQLSEHQNTLMEIITGMQDIKLNNSETRKRWDWELIQAQLYKVGIKSLSLSQYQQMGSTFFNHLKNILVSFISATAVLKGEMTLGMMLSVSYIIGQMNGPLEQLLGFIEAAQDAKISLDRLSEIHNLEEDQSNVEKTQAGLPALNGGLELRNVSFQYEGRESPFILRNINLLIPEGKVTAIVGSSGSGKTTLMKMLLQIYEPTEGEIWLGNRKLKTVPGPVWRNVAGAVMQEGYIFSDTVARNIAISDEHVDAEKLQKAIKTANIDRFIHDLPKGLQTRIGAAGINMSTGQKQRLHIARSVYKNPRYLFMDEATSALDAHNEKIIIENLDHFFKGRTVVVIAHRLSTVKHADQIIVLENGCIAETGNHETLVAQKGFYYHLVKNQLELGN